MDEDDAFLYGNDESGKETAMNKQVVPETPPKQEQTTVEDTKTPDQGNAGSDAGDESMDDSDYDSDSDVEFIVGGSKPTVSSAITKSTAPSAVSEKQPAAVLETASTVPGGLTVVPAMTEAIGLDINKVGSYNDIPVDHLALEELIDKPWRLPGADLSDYFNFGFDEVSWTLYCSKQEKIRKEFDPNTLIPRLISSGVIPPSVAAVMRGEANQGKNTQINSNPMQFMMQGMQGMPGMMPMNMFNNNQMNPMMGMMNNMNNMNNMSNNGNSNNNKRQSGTPEGSNGRMPSGPRDGRDSADRDFEKGKNGQQNYRERGDGGRRRRR